MKRKHGAFTARCSVSAKSKNRNRWRSRGGCWFECGDRQLHIGVEREFQPARKAHPAFAVDDLNAMRTALTAGGIEIIEDDNLPGADRFYADDPWGNRLEFLHVK